MKLIDAEKKIVKAESLEEFNLLGSLVGTTYSCSIIPHPDFDKPVAYRERLANNGWKIFCFEEC